jgi:hypothetical protein
MRPHASFPLPVLILTPLLLLAHPLAPGPLGTGALAQQAEIEASGFPRDMVDRLIRIVNDPGTVHYRGTTVIPRDSLVTGDMVVMGSLELAGEVDGDVIVVGGDAELRSGSWIRGDITVVDGELRNDDMGRIEGLAAQASRAVSRSVPGTRVTGRDPGVSVPISRDRDRGASSHFALRVTDYNRVEGLQVMAGPVLTTGGDNPFRTTALLIWRGESTDGPRGVDRTGFDVRMEQFLGGQRAFRMGGGVHSRVSPVEAWGLSDRENALGSFFLTTDQRDHFQRRGWSAFVRATPGSIPLDASLEFHREEHTSLAAGDPWSVFRNDRPWREQPLVAEGTTRALVARASVDTRDARREPGAGWFAEGSLRRNLGGTLVMPPAGIQGTGNSAPFQVLGPELDARFTTGMLDLRRYNSVGRGGRFNLRGVVGGTLDGAPVPPQFQHALGGVGSLPGHPPFAADCGARESLLVVDGGGEGTTLHRPFYGCDRFALFQAEYRGALNLRTGFGPPDVEEATRRTRRQHRPSWVVFFNAGRGWSDGEWGNLPRPDSPPLYDAGIGLILGQGGIYWAFPLGEHGEGSRFSLRLQRRF